ncbi:unnamed protein product [Rhizoctonia solani]|uniref:Ricin B lectin domain-containing protein n=1 Tax=Rhizoctonia solani TaxID=456999 RepID=A0A8H3HNT7_9AGAM|nr:unnamed protein product [Rhizoctonia solani]
MGQKPSHHTPDQDIKLGTYFIIHDCSGKAIQIDNQNYQKITVWDRHAGDNQQWYLQQSGKGYMFKNKQHGYYLGLSLADDSPFPVCASPYPASWVVMKQDPQAIGEGCPDETGEELPMQYQIERAQLQQDLAEKVAELSKKDRKLGRRIEDLSKKDSDIMRMKAELDAKDRGIRSRDQELMTKNQELARKEQELAMKDRELFAKSQEIAELKSLRPKPSIIRRLLQEAEMRSKGSRSRGSSRTSSVAPPVSVTYGSEFDFKSQDIEIRSQYSDDEDEILDTEVASLYARAEEVLANKGDDSETGSHYEY